MKEIYNPTESKVHFTIKGETYSVEAGESTIVSESVANVWGQIHQFLQIKDVVEVKKEEVKKEEQIEKVVEVEQPNEVVVKQPDEVVIKRAKKSKK